MVCLFDDTAVQVTIRDTIGERSKKVSVISLKPSTIIENIFSDIALDFHYQPDEIELHIEKEGHRIVLNQFKDKSLNQVGFDIDSLNQVNNIYIIPIQNKNETMTPAANDAASSEDTHFLSITANPSVKDVITFVSPHLSPSVRTNQEMRDVPTMDTQCYYVGLVNQAMTCYLNSLLQALYMTPEFRNALYNWEFDGQNETRSIPFQLQKLFLNLQTSTKSAVETTDLTTSFGWQSSEAWQQHDIQELCRVMFDALEQKFKDTKQANLINDLYEGKMLDYVRCLECGTEKSREDTFLDIPLPVKPFGNNVAYNSVEEALQAFVQPETLDGSNQYHCEKCNKKCDAHKGLKFIKFPYLLTLHLKRFDFDYNTMHRIKLNDKVVFPEMLNLNCFIPNASLENDSERETIVKCDDCSTTDSGSALDDDACHSVDTATTVNGQDLDYQEEDEGIDIGNNQDNERNRNPELKGPYVYELFSIMIHSGSASGGHYYAYIKDFGTNLWYCFNDQSVSRITEDDIKKTYGGGSQRGHYSGAYSPSTNAYMLMYRQINKERNCTAMTVENFPPHIRNLLKQMKEKEEHDRITKEKENDMVKLKVYCYHPVLNQLLDTKIVTFIDSELNDVVKDAHLRFKLEGIVALEDCRFVSYNKVQDCIDCSFQSDTLRLCDIATRVNILGSDWMLEIKQPGTEFQMYKRGGVNIKVFLVNLETEEVDGPTKVRVNAGETVREFKDNLSKILNMDVNTMKLVQETYSNEPKYLDDDDALMKIDPSCNGYKIYVSNALDEDPERPFVFSKLHKVIDQFVHVVSINVILPETDLVTLELLSIPPLDLNQNQDKQDSGSGDRQMNSPSLRVSPQPGSGNCSEGFGDQSNSEDSSLSDSDRTLVGDAPGDCLALLSSGSESPVDQHMASPSDPVKTTFDRDLSSCQFLEMPWDDEMATETPEPLQRCSKYYFKATQPMSINGTDTDTDSARCCRVLVDKRMLLKKFKKHLESIVGVPMEYFKIYRQYPNQDEEWTRLTDTLSSTKDGERLIVKLGRVLRSDEVVGKVYSFNPENTEQMSTFLFEHIVAAGQTAGSVKKEILFQAKKQHMLDIPYNKCRLREKSWVNPRKVYLDDQKLHLSNNFELFLQELPDVEKVTSTSQLVLLVRRWHPSTLTLSPFREVVLDTTTVVELKKKISEESGIPQEFVEFASSKSSFPCDMNVLSIHDELYWNPTVANLEDIPLQIYEDGSVIFYRDSREALKELTPEEKKELNHKENTRLGHFITRNYSLSGRERALKIYLDTSPSKSDDIYGD